MSNQTTDTVASFELVANTEGRVVETNLDEFRKMVAAVIAGLNLEPSTAAEFKQADADIKSLQQAEKNVAATKEHALKSAADLEQLFSALDESGEEIRQARLRLSTAVKAQKEALKEAAIDKAWSRLEQESLHIQHRDRLVIAIKGKRSMKEIEKALDAEANAALRTVLGIREALNDFAEQYGTALIPDRDQLENKSVEHVEGELRRRLEVQRLEDARKKAEDEAAKARTEARPEPKDVSEETAPAPKPKQEQEPEEPASAQALATKQWQRFEEQVFNAFAVLRKAKEQLTYLDNVERAKKFASGVNEAWKGVQP